MEAKKKDELLEKYLNGTSTLEEERWLFEHHPEMISEGAYYSQTGQNSLSNDFDTLIEDQLGPDLTSQTGKQTSWLIAASFTLAILSFIGGIFYQQKADEQLQNELSSVRSLMSDMLAEQQSAHLRLKAIEMVSGLRSLDQEELNVMVRLMNTDNNSNVRLAAVNLLTSRLDNDSVARVLLSSVETQDDFLVRAVLIKGLLESKKYRPALLDLINKSEINDEVKTQIKDGISNS